VNVFDKDLAAKHILEHYRPDDFLAVVLIKRGPDGKTLGVSHEYATAEALSSDRRQAHFRAANASGSDVYITVNALVAGTRNREKGDVLAIRHLFLDIDKSGPAVLRGVLESRELPKPRKVLCTSPSKYQVLWRVEGFSPDQAESVVRGMAIKYEADQSVWDCARILRMPGFRNHKIQDRFHAVSVVRSEPSIGILTPADFPVFPELERQIARGEGRKLEPGHSSKSERDWAMVLRKLERDEDPTAVKSWLERERPDKPNPGKYADYTVEKARQYRQRHPAASRCPKR
jgi:hypothetical protein